MFIGAIVLVLVVPSTFKLLIIGFETPYIISAAYIMDANLIVKLLSNLNEPQTRIQSFIIIV